jgi:hypothetical protein
MKHKFTVSNDALLAAIPGPANRMDQRVKYERALGGSETLSNFLAYCGLFRPIMAYLDLTMGANKQNKFGIFIIPLFFCSLTSNCCEPTSAYCGLFWPIVAYFGLLWFILAYWGLFWPVVAYFGLLWFISAYCGLFWPVVTRSEFEQNQRFQLHISSDILYPAFDM